MKQTTQSNYWSFTLARLSFLLLWLGLCLYFFQMVLWVVSDLIKLFGFIISRSLLFVDLKPIDFWHIRIRRDGWNKILIGLSQITTLPLTGCEGMNTRSKLHRHQGTSSSACTRLHNEDNKPLLWMFWYPRSSQSAARSVFHRELSGTYRTSQEEISLASKQDPSVWAQTSHEWVHRCL